MSPQALEVNINFQILKWARESAGLDIQNASSYLKLNTAIIQDWESGKINPTLTNLDKLAKFYKRPLATFFLPMPPKEPSLPKDFRVLPGKQVPNLSSETLFAIRKARNLQEIATSLMQELGRGRPSIINTIHLTDNPEDIAKEERKRLEIDTNEQFSWPNSYHAFNRWRDALEEISIFIFQMNMPLEEARGFSLLRGGVPVIVINLADSITARIFTTFHEYAHILLGEESICHPDEGLHITRNIKEEEIFCNHFAGAFLVPKEILKKDILNYAETNNYFINNISSHFKVSKDVILRRMLISQIINPRQYQNELFKLELQRKKIEKKKVQENKGFGQLPHRKCLSNRGNLFINLIFEAKEHGIICTNEMLDYLSIKLKYVDALKAIIKGKQRENTRSV